MAIYSQLMETLEEMSALEVIEVLCNEFLVGRTTIVFKTTGNRAEIRSFLSAVYLSAARASDVGPIEFYGGPPAKRDYYTGTLLTYLCDLILYRWSLHGEYGDLVFGDTYESKLPIID